jgi:hypothetical protein
MRGRGCLASREVPSTTVASSFFGDLGVAPHRSRDGAGLLGPPWSVPIASAPRRPRSVLVLLLLLSLGLVASACSRREMLTDAAVPDGGTDANDLDVGQDAAVESVTLYPLEREIVIRDGVIPRVPLEVRAHYGEGTEEVVVPATFTVTPGRLAVLDGTDLVPTGVAGGEVHVRLQALGRQGRYVQTETFVVRLETTVFGRDVDPAIVADFESSTEDASVVSPTLGYPLDGAQIGRAHV